MATGWTCYKCESENPFYEKICWKCGIEYGKDEDEPNYCDNPACLIHNCDGNH